MVDFGWQIFSKEKRVVTANFTTFFTARKDMCHLELTLGAFSPKKEQQNKNNRRAFRGLCKEIPFTSFPDISIMKGRPRPTPKKHPPK